MSGNFSETFPDSNSNRSQPWRRVNTSSKHLLTYSLPALEFGLYSQITLYALYSLTVLLSVVGNVVVVYVLALGARSKRLSKMLINLAISDLLTACFCMPFTFTETLLGRWVFGDVMCPVVSFMAVVAVSASVLTNTAIAIDRYRAVTMPIDQHINKNRTKSMLCVIWLSALVIATPLLVTSRSVDFQYGVDTYQACDETWRERDRTYYTFALLVLTYATPLTVITVAYVHVLRALKTRPLPGNTDYHVTARGTKQRPVNPKVVKMLLVVAALFALSWLPLHVFRVVLDVAPSHLFGLITDYKDETIFYAIFYGCHWLAMSNSFMNPIIYSFVSDNFKMDCARAFSRTRLFMKYRRLSFRLSASSEPPAPDK